MSEELVIKSSIIEDLEKIEIASEQQEAIVRQSNSAYGLLSSIPMKCRGNQCPYASICPLLENGLAEIGSRCALEATMVRDMFVAYCTELDINPDVDKIKAGLVKDLCSVEIQALRANKLMSFSDFIVDAVEAINPVTGDIIYRDDLHIAVAWSERLLNQKIRILDTLAASPLVRAKYLGGLEKKSILDAMAEKRQLVEKMMQTDNSDEAEYEITDWREE